MQKDKLLHSNMLWNWKIYQYLIRFFLFVEIRVIVCWEHMKKYMILFCTFLVKIHFGMFDRTVICDVFSRSRKDDNLYSTKLTIHPCIYLLHACELKFLYILMRSVISFYYQLKLYWGRNKTFFIENCSKSSKFLYNFILLLEFLADVIR